MRPLNHAKVMEAAAEAYALRDEIEAREAIRAQPVAFDCDWQSIVTIAIAFLMGCTLGGLFG